MTFKIVGADESGVLPARVEAHIAALIAAASISTIQRTNTQTGTSYTPVLSDAGKLITLNNAAAITFTFPTNASVPFPVETFISTAQLGAGQVTHVAAGGVTLLYDPLQGPKLVGINTFATAFKLATNTWLLGGRLTA